MLRPQLGPSVIGLSDDEDDTLGAPWNGGSHMEVDAFQTQEKNNDKMGDEEEGRQKEKLADANFFNTFEDDFDESDMKLNT